MRWFGKHWGAPICTECEHAPTPIGNPCEFCTEPIEKNDDGFLLPLVSDSTIVELAYHYECHLRLVFGSVAHQVGVCACFVHAAPETDPQELTKRQAARLAVELWETHQRVMMRNWLENR